MAGDDGFYEDTYDSPHDLDPSNLRLKQQQQYKARMMRRPILEEMSDDGDADADSDMGWMRGGPSRAEVRNHLKRVECLGCYVFIFLISSCIHSLIC